MHRIQEGVFVKVEQQSTLTERALIEAVYIHGPLSCDTTHFNLSLWQCVGK